jgi:hypothetical protein
VLIVNPERIADIYSAIHTIADAVGVPERGDALVAKLQRDITAIATQLETAPRPRVLLVVGRAPIVAAGRGTYQDELIGLAHGENLAGDLEDVHRVRRSSLLVSAGQLTRCEGERGPRRRTVVLAAVRHHLAVRIIAFMATAPTSCCPGARGGDALPRWPATSILSACRDPESMMGPAIAMLRAGSDEEDSDPMNGGTTVWPRDAASFELRRRIALAVLVIPILLLVLFGSMLAVAGGDRRISPSRAIAWKNGGATRGFSFASRKRGEVPERRLSGGGVHPERSAVLVAILADRYFGDLGITLVSSASRSSTSCREAMSKTYAIRVQRPSPSPRSSGW